MLFFTQNLKKIKGASPCFFDKNFKKSKGVSPCFFDKNFKKSKCHLEIQKLLPKSRQELESGIVILTKKFTCPQKIVFSKLERCSSVY